MRPDHPDSMVVVAVANRLTEADVMRAALEASGIPAYVQNEFTTNWFSHMGLAINPKGVKVFVPRGAIDEARQVLGLDRLEVPDQAAPPTEAPDANGDRPMEHPPDYYAERAYRAALYTWWFPAIAPMTIYLLLLTWMAKSDRPVENPRRFRRHLAVAIPLGIVMPTALLLLLLAAITDFDFRAILPLDVWP